MRIATSMDDLEVGQVIASYTTMEGPEELVRAGRVVGFSTGPDPLNVLVDNEVGETKKIGFHSYNTVFILAEAPVDPVKEAWEAWNKDHFEYEGTLAHRAFLAGWKAKEESCPE